jgi:hypothetical protein
VAGSLFAAGIIEPGARLFFLLSDFQQVPFATQRKGDPQSFGEAKEFGCTVPNPCGCAEEHQSVV